MPKYGLIFDLDGTLTDSGPGIIHSVMYALEKLGYPVASYEQLRTFVGPPLGSSFLSYGVREEEVEEAIRRYRENYNVNGKKENECYPGISDLLRRLQSEGYALYVATSKPETLAKSILDGFGLSQFFTIIAGATYDHTRENKDDVIRYLLDQCGDEFIPIMIGDTVFDVIGARKVGIDCIGVAWGYGEAADMRAEGALAIADTPSDLYEILKAL
ncbi:MAG: HAD-IA family hydrolase [Oscillospiraceae bacterium]|nr:HAD-IA family hydrolase [Oscillospiraceae bacterium]